MYCYLEGICIAITYLNQQTMIWLVYHDPTELVLSSAQL
jgi:hypothetical protein